MNDPRLYSRRSFLRRSLAGGAVWLGWPERLAWAVEPGSGTSGLKVAYFTDIHARVEWETPDALLMAASAINQHQPDLVLCGGDMITDGYTSGRKTVAPRWDAYLAMQNAIRPYPEVAVGNHDLVGVAPEDGSDILADPREDVRTRFGLAQTYRSFDRSGYHFMILDSVQVTDDELRYRGYIDATQQAWIKDDLAGVDPRTPIVVVCHMPMVTSFFQLTNGVESAVPPNRGLVNSQEVLSLFEHHRLLLVLQGHLHVNEMIRWRNTTFITGGAVCGKWWRGAWHGTAEGFGLVTLHPDKVEWEYHTYGWSARRPANA